jgi:hypothetical protein
MYIIFCLCRLPKVFAREHGDTAAAFYTALECLEKGAGPVRVIVGEDAIFLLLPFHRFIDAFDDIVVDKIENKEYNSHNMESIIEKQKQRNKQIIR